MLEIHVTRPSMLTYVPYAPTSSRTKSAANIQLKVLFWRTFDFNTSNRWKHCQNRNNPTSTSPSPRLSEPSRPRAQTAPVKKSTAVSVSNRESRLMRRACSCLLFFLFPLASGLGTTFNPQKMAGNPINNVMLVTLLTRQLVITSAAGWPLLYTTKTKIRLPMPEQYGMTRVPSTVPSTPVSVMCSNRQIRRNEEPMNNTNSIHGLNGPKLSMNVVREDTARS